MTLLDSGRRFFTPPSLGKLLGVSAIKILDEIQNGALHAVNLSNGQKRPRWHISPDAAEAWLQSRSNATTKPTTPRTDRKIPKPPKKYV